MRSTSGDVCGPGGPAPRLIEGFIATALPAEAGAGAEQSAQALSEALQQRLAADDSQPSSGATQAQSHAAAAEGTGTWSVKLLHVCTIYDAALNHLTQLSMNARRSSCPHCHAKFLMMLCRQFVCWGLSCRCTVRAPSISYLDNKSQWPLCASRYTRVSFLGLQRLLTSVALVRRKSVLVGMHVLAS